MINKLILGTAQFGFNYGINNSTGKVSKHEAFKILDYAYKNNIRTIDTAESYGNSQQILGMYLAANPTKKFKIITKIDINKNYEKTHLIDSIISSKELLNINFFEGYMFHDYKFFKDSEYLFSKLEKAKEMGLLKTLGISLYNNNEIEDIIQNYNFDFIQIPFNLLDNSSKRKSILIMAKERNIDVHVRSVFLQGLFFKSKEIMPTKLKPLIKYINDLEEICLERNISIDELAIKYNYSKSYIDKIIFGVDNLNQLKRNIEIMKSNILIPNKTIDKINVLENELLNPSNW